MFRLQYMAIDHKHVAHVTDGRHGHESAKQPKPDPKVFLHCEQTQEANIG